MMSVLRFQNACAAALLSCALLTACGGDVSEKVDTTSAAAVAQKTTDSTNRANAVPSTAAPSTSFLMVQGQSVYASCASCHGQNGEGAADSVPPLVGAELVTGSSARAIAIVLNGMKGPVAVKGKNYVAVMQAYGKGVPLSDVEIASVLTYIRGSWGNSAAPVTVAAVAAARTEHKARTSQWSAAELQALK